MERIIVTNTANQKLSEHESPNEAVNHYGVSKSSVNRNLNGKFHAVKGYKFWRESDWNPQPNNENTERPTGHTWKCSCGHLVSQTQEQCPICHTSRDSQKFKQTSRLVTWYPVGSGTGKIVLEWHEHRGYIVTILASGNRLLFWSEFYALRDLLAGFQTEVDKDLRL